MSKTPFAECSQCGLQGCPFVPPRNVSQARFAIVGEAPGFEEARSGEPFVGQSGQLLNALLKQLGVDRSEVHVTNTVLCRPPGNRTPTRAEIDCCRQRLLHELGQMPRLERVLALGKTAMQSLASRYNKTITSQRGQYQPIDGSNLPMMATYHPAAVLRNPGFFDQLRSDIGRFFARGPVTTVEPVPYTIAETAADIKEFNEAAPQDSRYITLDVESDSLDWRKGRLLAIGLGCDERILIVPEPLIYDAESRIMLTALFTSHGFVGHNAKFDAKFIKQWFDVLPYIEDDTMLMHYALDEVKGTHGLKDLVMEHFGVEYESRVLAYVKKEGSYRDVPKPILYEYLARDVYYTTKLAEIFTGRMRLQGLYERPYKLPLMQASRAITEVELNGVPMNADGLQALDVDLDHAEVRLVGDLQRLAGDYDLNPRSPQQLSKVLYDKLGMPPVKTKTGNAGTTNEEALLQWQKVRPHPFLDRLLEYRGLTKLRSTYVQGLLKCVDEGRVWPDYLLHASVTGRLAATDPAIMTITRPADEWTLRLRQCIAAPPGRSLVYCDYSQAEFRVWAWASQDPAMVAAYQAGSDMHSLAAEAFFGKGFTKEQRVLTKRFNFGYIYRGGLYAIATSLGLPTATAQRLMDRYASAFSVGVKWLDDAFVIAKKQGYIEEPVFHRRRRFPLITNDNVEDIRKQSANAPIQGLASDLTLMSLSNVVRTLPPTCKAVLFMHDAIMVECPTEAAQDIAQRVCDIMVKTAAAYLGDSVPFVAEAEIGTYWK